MTPIKIPVQKTQALEFDPTNLYIDEISQPFDVNGTSTITITTRLVQVNEADRSRTIKYKQTDVPAAILGILTEFDPVAMAPVITDMNVLNQVLSPFFLEAE